jgi:hypothetical protein
VSTTRGPERRAQRVIEGAGVAASDFPTSIVAVGQHAYRPTLVDVYFRCGHGYGRTGVTYREWVSLVMDAPTKTARQRRERAKAITEMVKKAVARHHMSRGTAPYRFDAPELEQVVAL